MVEKVKYFATAATYCITQKKKTLNTGPVTVHKTKNNATMVKSICRECGNKKSVLAPANFGK